jgi:hypothetical protein
MPEAADVRIQRVLGSLSRIGARPPGPVLGAYGR